VNTSTENRVVAERRQLLVVKLDGGPQPWGGAHQLVELLVRLVVVGPVDGFGDGMVSWSSSSGCSAAA
jgi:hypothetical protein